MNTELASFMSIDIARQLVKTCAVLLTQSGSGRDVTPFCLLSGQAGASDTCLGLRSFGESLAARLCLGSCLGVKSPQEPTLDTADATDPAQGRKRANETRPCDSFVLPPRRA